MADKKDSIVSLGLGIGGIILAIAAVFVIFANDQLEWLASIAWGLVVLGAMLGVILGILRYKKK